MAKKQTRKPAARRTPARPKAGGSRAARLGWVAAVAIGGAWAVSNDLGGVGTKLDNGTATARQALGDLSRWTTNEVASVEPKRRPAASAERATAQMTTGSIPTPRERAVPPPADDIGTLIVAARPPAPVPQPAPMLPFAKPPVEATLRAPKPSPLAPQPATGEKRHATRQLAAYAEPNGTSRKLADIGAASSVLVLRAAGGWRYVRATGSGAEGWVDGRYLAGEAAAGLASFAPR